MAQYIRFQGDAISSRTRRPQGLFAVLWFLEQAGRLSAADARTASAIRDWFEENVPDPPLYEEGNVIRATTWFKAGATEALERARRIQSMLADYGVSVREIRSADLGTVVYEDPYQVAVIDA